MFAHTQPKQVVEEDARRASHLPEKRNAAAMDAVAADYITPDSTRRAVMSGHKVSSRGGMDSRDGLRVHSAGSGRNRPGSGTAELPPIQYKRQHSNTAVEAHPLTRSSGSSFNRSPKSADRDLEPLPLLFPTSSTTQSRVSSAAASNSGRNDKRSSQSRSQRPPSRTARLRSVSFSRNAAASGHGAGQRQGRSPTQRSPLKILKEKVERDELVTTQLLHRGNTGGALALLRRILENVLAFKAKNAAGARGSVSGSVTVPQPVTAPQAEGNAGAAWATETAQRLAEGFTVIACNAGVRSSAAAESFQVQEAYFQEAMRYVVTGVAEDLFPEWKAAGETASPAPGRKPQPPSSQPRRKKLVKSNDGSPSSRSRSCFASGRGTKIGGSRAQQSVLLRRLLRSAVRANAAVCLGDSTTSGGQARIVYELLKALAEADGVWSTAILYNLAVSFLRVGSYDDAAEAIARYMELSLYYLEWAQNTRDDEEYHHHINNSEGGLDEGTGNASSVAYAVHGYMAHQLIRGHHFIAAMAAWCDPQGATEVYHCELAAACARHYLSAADGQHRECARRLAAARARARAEAVDDETAELGSGDDQDRAQSASSVSPLLLPFVTQELFLSCAVPTRGMATAPSRSTTLTLSVVVEAFAATSTLASSLPLEIRAYLREVQNGDCLRYWAQKAIAAGATAPFLSAAIAADSTTPWPVALSILLNHDEAGDGAWTRQGLLLPETLQASTPSPPNPSEFFPASVLLEDLERSAVSSGVSKRRTVAAGKQRHPLAPSPPASNLNAYTPTHQKMTLQGSTTPSMVLSPCKPSKPTPLFVTSIPFSAYDRYRNLRMNIVSQLESAEELEQQQLYNSDGEDSKTTSVVFVKDGEAVERVGSAGSRSTATVTTAVAGPAMSRERAQRITALLVGASSRAPTPTRSPSHDQRDVQDLMMGKAGTERDRDAEEYGCVNMTNGSVTLDGNVLAIPVRPSELLRQLDQETETYYSRLVVDPLADLWRNASTRLQAWWRMQVARNLRLLLAQQVKRRLRCEEGAFRIQRAYQQWKERAPARAELQRRRAELERVRCVAVVQAFIRQRESVEVWGQVCLAWYRTLVIQRKIAEQRAAAAVTLQSWWRMYTTRRQMRDVVAAVLRIQCSWRCTLARHELRARRVHRRLAEEKWRQDRLPQIIYVQRLWRACRSRLAVRHLLPQKQRDVQAYLAAQESEYHGVMSQLLRTTNNVEWAMRSVLAVLAGARDRRRLAVLQAHACIRRRAVHRYVLRWRGALALQRLHHERDAALALRRRREEVAVAVIKIQSWIRQRMLQRREMWNKICDAQLDANARKLQRAFRHHRARQQFAQGATGRHILFAAHRNLDLRSCAATRIQAYWRMCRVKRQFTDRYRFLWYERHRYATALQRVWRGHYARTVSVPQQRAYVASLERYAQQRAVQHCAAIRIQSLFRMYRTRCALRELGGPLPNSLLYRNASARLIQKHWRAYAAAQRARFLHLDRSYAQKQALSREALDAYATQIQAVFRGYLVRREIEYYYEEYYEEVDEEVSVVAEREETSQAYYETTYIEYTFTTTVEEDVGSQGTSEDAAP